MKTKDMELFSEVLHEVEKIDMSPALSLLRLPRLQLLSAFSPSSLPPQQLPSVLLPPTLVSVGIFSESGPEHSVEFLVVIWNHHFDGLAVLIVFVFMMQGKVEALPGFTLLEFGGLG